MHSKYLLIVTFVDIYFLCVHMFKSSSGWELFVIDLGSPSPPSLKIGNFLGSKDTWCGNDNITHQVPFDLKHMRLTQYASWHEKGSCHVLCQIVNTSLFFSCVSDFYLIKDYNWAKSYTIWHHGLEKRVYQKLLTEGRG